MLLAILLGLLAFADRNLPELPGSPASKAVYDQTKANLKPGISDANRTAALELVLTSALARRGHSGDRSYMQGCDLTDQATAYDEANRKLIAASATWAEYASYWHEALPDHDYGRRLLEGPAENIAKARADADQRARRLLGDGVPEGQIGAAVSDLRLINLCAVDLPNSEWLQEEDALRLFETSTDSDVLRALYFLAIHADDRPLLQARFGQIYDERRRSLGWPVEPGLRLVDRAQINLGQPQPYATAVLCENGQPVFAGAVELETANARRVAAGLPPQDLQEKMLNGFCGSPALPTSATHP